MSLGGDMYQQQILDHYKNPRNYGELDNPDVTHTGENTSCGDTIQVDIQLTDDGDTIKYAMFTGDGCAISIAAISMLSQELQGMPVDELVNLDTKDITDMLGVQISPMRIKCAVLGRQVAQDGVQLHEPE